MGVILRTILVQAADMTSVRSICPFCGTQTLSETKGGYVNSDGYQDETSECHCPLCGYQGEVTIAANLGSRKSILREFSVDSFEPTIRELASHLHTFPEDLIEVNPYRFEELVASAFDNHDLDPYLTKKSHDGGVDIFFTRKNQTEIEVVLEVKRYKGSVGIGIVQRLAGAALDWGASRATLVTSSRITKFAKQSIESINADGRIEMSFVEADDLLTRLKVYNPDMPLLSKLTPKLRSEIIARNGGTFE